jgi:hypothetical protein
MFDVTETKLTLHVTATFIAKCMYRGCRWLCGSGTLFHYLHNPCLVMNARGGVNHVGLITTITSVRPFVLTMLITFSFCDGVCSGSLQFGFPGSFPPDNR